MVEFQVFGDRVEFNMHLLIHLATLKEGSGDRQYAGLWILITL
jgi:hypothetical protein